MELGIRRSSVPLDNTTQTIYNSCKARGKVERIRRRVAQCCRAERSTSYRCQFFIIVLFSFKIACILKKNMYFCECKNFINSTILTIKTNII